MKYRIAFLATLFLFLAGAAMATPSTGEPPVPGGAGLAAAWDLDSFEAPAGYALGASAAGQEPTELAVYGPCGCTPIPGCPFPIPWPSPGPTFPFPLPLPDSCKCPTPF